jgi:hypothetical protein
MALHIPPIQGEELSDDVDTHALFRIFTGTGSIDPYRPNVFVYASTQCTQRVHSQEWNKRFIGQAITNDLLDHVEGKKTCFPSQKNQR